ncbi:MAG TPA: cytochrome c [Thermoanaerobaculia bacterium]
MKKTATILILMLLAAIALPAMAEDGAALYKAKCAACHGPDGAKMAKANLTTIAKSEADIVTFLTTNDKHKTKVDEAGAKAVAAFVKTLKK